jgi:hypothetical protein
MPIFIGIDLILCFFTQSSNALESLLETTTVMHVSLGIAIISFMATLFQRLRHVFLYDLFSSGLLLVWFAYWKTLFKYDSPMFFIFPLYFLMITAFASLFFISARHRIDIESLKIMRVLDKKNIMQPSLIMSCVFLSLVLEDYFLLYPTMMTLLIFRFALASCVVERSY